MDKEGIRLLRNYIGGGVEMKYRLVAIDMDGTFIG